MCKKQDADKFKKLFFVNFLGYKTETDNAICILDIPNRAIYNKITQKGLFYGMIVKKVRRKKYENCRCIFRN